MKVPKKHAKKLAKTRFWDAFGPPKPFQNRRKSYRNRCEKKTWKKRAKKVPTRANKETCLSKEREARKVIRAVEACNVNLENLCEKQTRKKGSKSRNIGQMIVFETPNGSNPPTRSLTGPKSPKSVQSAQISQNPRKTSQILPKPSKIPPQTFPKPFPNPRKISYLLEFEPLGQFDGAWGSLWTAKCTRKLSRKPQHAPKRPPKGLKRVLR